jgi:uncharacterized repeat protein (TIGR03803 family)
MQEGGTMRRFFLTTGMVAGLLHAATANAQTSLLYTENVLHNFAGGSDGSNPYGGLIADASGALYGMTSQGGASNLGVVFKLTPVSGQSAWNETILYAFKGGTDGATPYGGLLLGRRGVLYGVTEFGGEPELSLYHQWLRDGVRAHSACVEQRTVDRESAAPLRGR